MNDKPCAHGVKGGCMACRPCQCGCKLDKHFVRYSSNEGVEVRFEGYGVEPARWTGCTEHADCGGYMPRER